MKLKNKFGLLKNDNDKINSNNNNFFFFFECLQYAGCHFSSLLISHLILELKKLRHKKAENLIQDQTESCFIILGRCEINVATSNI